MDRKWLRSEEGKAFVGMIIEEVAARGGKQISGGGFVNNLAADQDSDWIDVVNDFILGLGASIGESDPAKVDPTGLFAAALKEGYRERFDALYLKGLDVTLLKQQAETLGLITGNIYRLNKGDFGSYPKKDPSLTAPQVKHLQWARDVVGFWAGGHVQIDFGVPSPPQPKATALVEFSNGCTLC